MKSEKAIRFIKSFLGVHILNDVGKQNVPITGVKGKRGDTDTQDASFPLCKPTLLTQFPKSSSSCWHHFGCFNAVHGFSMSWMQPGLPIFPVCNRYIEVPYHILSIQFPELFPKLLKILRKSWVVNFTPSYAF